MTTNITGYIKDENLVGEMEPGGSGTTVITNYDDTEIRKLISKKVDKVDGKGLSTNDFTDEYKNKLDNFSGNVDGGSGAETDPTVPQHVKNITEKDIQSWNNKSDFNGSYNSLKDVPSEFTPKAHRHDVSEVDNLNIPTKISELTNDSGFVDSQYVIDLINSAITTAIGGAY